MNGNRTIILLFLIGAFLCSVGAKGEQQIPHFISYQGRLVLGGTNYHGWASFKFALVNLSGDVTYWSNDGTLQGEPLNGVTTLVTRGVFSLRLGDTNFNSMVALPPNVFTNGILRLRIWYNIGSGYELVQPDFIIASVPYAMTSAQVLPGAIRPEMLAAETVAQFLASTGGVMSGGVTNWVGFWGNFYGNAAGLTNFSPGTYPESDPVFQQSAAGGITAVQTSHWTQAFLWGDHSGAGYLVASNNLMDLPDVSLARFHLGLGSIATQSHEEVFISGGNLRDVALQVRSNQFSVGGNQLVVQGGNVGIGTSYPQERLVVVGGTEPGEYIIRIYSGTNPIAWGRKK